MQQQQERLCCVEGSNLTDVTSVAHVTGFMNKGQPLLNLTKAVVDQAKQSDVARKMYLLLQTCSSMKGGS